MRKRKAGFVVVIIMVFSMFLFSGYCFAQDLVPDNPCDGTDPDLECPIDSGTVIFVTVTLTYGFIKLSKLKQKSFVN